MIPTMMGSAPSQGGPAELRRLSSWVVLLVAVATLLPAACTCGPEIPGTTDDDTETTIATESSATNGSTDTGPSTRCGDGIPAAGEHCFDQVDLDVPADHLVVGDFDGDGVPDIATNRFEDGAGVVQLVLWRPGGAPVVQDPVESRSRSELSLLVDDFDGDDDADLVVVVPGELRLHRNDGEGQLSPEVLDDTGIFWPSAPIDVDADGRSEIIAGTGSGAQVQVYALVAGAWTPQGGPYGMSACAAYSLLTTDLDADGKDDVVEVGWPGECPAFPDYDADLIPIAVFHGVGDGSLSLVGELATGAQPVQAVAGDLNGDGISDLAVVNQGSSDLSVLVGTGSLGFDPQRRLDFDDLGAPLRHAAVGDADGDGAPELLVTVGGSLYAVTDPLGASTVTELAETTHPVMVADFNADGVLDIVLLRPGSPLRVSILVSNP
jgi:FG-GAP-like repeat